MKRVLITIDNTLNAQFLRTVFECKKRSYVALSSDPGSRPLRTGSCRASRAQPNEERQNLVAQIM